MAGSPTLLHCICGGDAGAASEGGAGGGGGRDDDDDDDGGGGGAGGGAWTLCPDLDGNNQADCNETQVRNATFDFDTENWSSPQGGIALAWEDTDAHAGERSGSLSVENLMSVDIDGSSVVGARQCFPVSGGADYRMAAEISVPELGIEGSGGLQLVFYDEVGCTGELVGAPVSSFANPGPAWRAVTLEHYAPPEAKSGSLRLVSVKLFRDTAFKVLFDNVLVVREE
jgi:hypothetical protein